MKNYVKQIFADSRVLFNNISRLKLWGIYAVLTVFPITYLVSNEDTNSNLNEQFEVRISKDNFSSLLAEKSNKIMNQFVEDGKKVLIGQQLLSLQLTNSEPKQNTIVVSKRDGIFFSAASLGTVIPAGLPIGYFLQVNRPDVLFFQFVDLCQLELNLGDEIRLRVGSKLLFGKITIIIGNGESEAGLKMGIKFNQEFDYLLMKPESIFLLTKLY